MKKIFLLKWFAFFLMISASFVSCSKDDNLAVIPTSNATDSYSGKLTRDYFNLLCDVSKTTPGCVPPVVARAYGYTGIAAYEAVVNGIPGASSLGGQLNG
jgi:hypothetical protein